jgi:hypothetical protein
MHVWSRDGIGTQVYQYMKQGPKRQYEEDSQRDRAMLL